MKLCFATHNEHKITEVKHLLGGLLCLVSAQELGCVEELPEEGDTLERNSLQKAEYIFKKYGIGCFADDTGLEVEALNYAPGVYSARYAGDRKNSQDNIRLLLQNLAGEANRRARFRTVMTLVWSKGIHQFEGAVHGTIPEHTKGRGGFGYDSVFIPEGYTVSMAEMTLEEKNRISHRKKAMDEMVRFLKQFLL